MEDIICLRCDSTNDYRVEQSGPHKKAVCNKCNRYIKFIPQSDKTLLHFGKYKGREIVTMRSDDELAYLYWLQKTNIKRGLKIEIENHLKSSK